MRKTIVDLKATASADEAKLPNAWLDLDRQASVEITSEDALFPIENALNNAASAGWQAASKGPQLIRLNFAEPVAIRRIHLHFVDRTAERSQEFALYARTDASPAGGGNLRELVRQQFSFSPGGSTEEIEDYAVDLHSVTSLELRIDPDRAHDPTHSQHFAVLQSLRLA